jgi:succinate dehydrogenase / fumarate reductase, cytochrome b subunit
MSNIDENKEGIKGMANPGRYGIERVAYWLMRLSGLGLLGYFVAHIYETSNILQGRVGWQEFLDLTQTTEGHIFLAIVIGMCVFHTGNGIRVMLGHGGVGVGKPTRPDYPYTPLSQNARHKMAIYSSIVLAAIAMMYGLAVMFGEAV